MYQPSLYSALSRSQTKSTHILSQEQNKQDFTKIPVLFLIYV